MTFLKKALVSFGGLGYGPIAPGTWGTAGAAAVYVVVAQFALDDPLHWAMFAAAGAVVFTILTALLGKWAERQYGKKDPGQVVTDEVAGFFVASIFVVAGPLWFKATAAFFLFRFFDIAKLYPACRVEHLPHGWGIALDDVVAGIYAAVAGNLALVAYNAYFAV